MPATKRDLKKFIKELQSIRGRHTELVSVYIPTGYDLNKIINHLAEEQGTAKNIKDAKTRGNVIDSLEKCIRHLRLINRTPPNGIALFAGNIAAQEGKVDLRVWSIEPPEPLNTRIYRCDQTFVLDILQEQLEHKEVYALITMDRREATLGLLKGTSITVLSHITSGVPGKFKAGGQSSQRFHRLIEGMALEFYKRVAELAQQEFLHLKNLKGILVGGPGPTKNAFIEQLNEELKRKIIAVQDITYTDESGLNHLVEKSQDILANEILLQEKQAMARFFELLAKDTGRVAYGKNDVKEKLHMGAVETLLISEDFNEHEAEEFEETAKNYGTTVKYISTNTAEGQQLRDLGGIAALLRYSM